MPCAAVTANSGSHDADRTRSDDEYILSQYVELQRCVHRVSERIEKGSNVEVNRRMVHPYIGGRNDEIFGKGPGPIDPDALRARAHVSPPSHTITTPATYNMTFARDDLPNMKISHVRSGFNYFAHELVSDDHGHRNSLLSPFVPLPDVHISPAYGGPPHSDKNIVDAGDWHRGVCECQARTGLRFHKSFHGALLICAGSQIIICF
jgi:hypothetical protein